MSAYKIEEDFLTRKETFGDVAAAIPRHQPTDIFLDVDRVAEDAGDNQGFGWLTAEDQDESEIFVFSIIDDAGGRFSIDENGQLIVAKGSLLDYETAQSHLITVRVTDRTGLTFDKSFVISVIDSGFDGKATDPFLFGSNGADTLSGTAGNDTISGALGNDILQGFASEDWLRGGGGNDTMRGGDGDDWLAGHEGRDVLYGGRGRDEFIFDTKPDRKNIDRIADYSVKDDTLLLDNMHMTKLGSPSGLPTVKLKKAFFVIGTKAKDKNDYVIYNDKKGVLLYDADGSGKGKAVEIATFSKNLKMTAADFLIL